MLYDALELLDARVFWCVCLCSESNAWDEPAGLDLVAICAINVPLVGLLVESGTLDVAVEPHMWLEIKRLLEVGEVSPKLFPIRIPLLEREVLPDIFIKQLVDGGVTVNTGAGVAVPVPILVSDATDVCI